MLESFYLKSSGDGRRLRIGVMIDSDHLDGHCAAVLDQIAASNFAELALVIRNASGAITKARHRSPLRTLRNLMSKGQRARAVYNWYQSWDRRRSGVPARVFANVDCGRLFTGVPELTVAPHETGSIDRFPSQAVAEIKSHDLDVILCFGFRILRGDILESARYGLWSYHHGDDGRFKGEPSHYWEISEEVPLSGALLQVLSEKPDSGFVLAKTLAATRFGFSVARNSIAPYLSAEHFVIRKLHQLHQYGWEAVVASAPPKEDYKGRKPIYHAPAVRELAGFVAKGVLSKVKRRMRTGGCNGYWRTAIRPVRGTSTPPWAGDWSDFKWCGPERDFLADPQLFEHNGRTWMFVEHFDYSKGRGNICCAEILDNGTVTEMKCVLDTPYHLSYPFVFRHDGQIYMIPESCEVNRIDLFRAVEFPHKWEHDHTLLDKPGMDTVLHVGEDGGFYFFTSFRQTRDADPTLFLFRADGLREPWRLHPASPISLDARYARNAGPILSVGNELYRPSQDLTLFYGRQMHFHKIVRLNPREYVEEVAGERPAAPEWDSIIGTHTYSRTAKWEAIDGYLLVRPAASLSVTGGKGKLMARGQLRKPSAQTG